MKIIISRKSFKSEGDIFHKSDLKTNFSLFIFDATNKALIFQE